MGNSKILVGVLNIIFLSLSFSVFLISCDLEELPTRPSKQKRSLAQVAQMKYTNNSGGVIQWDFTYEESRLLEIKRQIAEKDAELEIFSKQSFEWSEEGLLKSMLIEEFDTATTKRTDDKLVKYTWAKDGLKKIDIVQKFEKFKLPTVLGVYVSGKHFNGREFFYENKEIIASEAYASIELKNYLEATEAFTTTTITQDSDNCNLVFNDVHDAIEYKCTFHKNTIVKNPSNQITSTNESSGTTILTNTFDKDHLFLKTKIEQSSKTVVNDTGNGERTTNQSSSASAEYTYGEKNRVKSIKAESRSIQGLGKISVNFEYDEKGRIIKVFDAFDNNLQLTYNDSVEGLLPVTMPNIFGVLDFYKIDLEGQTLGQDPTDSDEITPY